jgi:hypothetical protein
MAPFADARLETQRPADNSNQPHLRSTILQPCEAIRSATIWRLESARDALRY